MLIKTKSNILKFATNKKCKICKFKLEGKDGIWCDTDLYGDVCNSFVPSRTHSIDYELIGNSVAFKA